MADFFKITTQETKTSTEIFPKFKVGKSQDLMIRGGDFYAVWREDLGLWSTDGQDVIDMVDREIDEVAKVERAKLDNRSLKLQYMWDGDSGSIDKWKKYCTKQRDENDYRDLDETLIFSNTPTDKKNYASKKLNYPLEPGECPAYEKMISTLYSEEERHKIEWAIGSIVTGDSKKLQKFMVLYGAAGTGKSTILNIIQMLFDGYYCVFDAKALGQANNQFALEPFKCNPLVAIQHDGDLSHIEDNTRLNSLVSHEEMTVNEKFKSTYTSRFKCFLFMGTNKPVKITDGKSGLLRRLIDVTPSGKKLNSTEYKHLMKQIPFELGAIASHCKDVYLDDPSYYDDYVPIGMMGASNDFYNYVIDCYHVFKKEDGTTLKAAWEMYKVYCDEAKVAYPFSQRNFKEELKNYFWEYEERFNFDDGSRARNYYKGFRTDIFETEKKPEGKVEKNKPKSWIELKEQKSIFDSEMTEEIAQYASSKETPSVKWDECTTRLMDLDTSRLHYVKVPENHIVIDFDIKNEKGEKDLDLNLAAASSWPATYVELSKGGSGLHLHYIYSGDVTKLSRVYDDNIEIKVFTGKSSLRRKLTMCNAISIATISSGLPLKEEAKVIDREVVRSEKGLRTTIKKCLAKEVHPSTKSNVDFIFKVLEDAYESGMHYDVSDMYNDIFTFAANSTHQADYCIKLVSQMKFHSEDPAESVDSDKPLVFYDIEVFPNLLLINWKKEGLDSPMVRMINPTPSDIEELIRFNLVGFNCRRYDNHVVYARLMGYDNEQIYNLSQRIISAQKGDANSGLFKEAYNLSKTDIYDFASAGNKKSLKKLEIDMQNAASDPKSDMDDYTRTLCSRIKHHELGLPWDQPVPEEKWIEVANYCDDDVYATEAAFHYLSADWTARQILADLANSTVNDTTNSLTTKIIFGNNRKPQDQFNYRNMAEPVFEIAAETKQFLEMACPEMMSVRHGEAGSLLPYFPGYTFDRGKSIYRGEEVGEGGYVYAEPGIYGNVALLDVASMHPHSLIAECLFGVKFTMAFRDIVEGRVSIKHEAWDVVNTMLDGKLTPFIQKVINGEMTSGQLANALKTAINSVYGLTSASFDNPFRDRRNIDNIVAKRGALFMIDLKNEVQKRGYTVAHIKTDSIKIPDATPEIIQFVMDFGLKYGYTFEHEATYERMCLVNDAVYIAKYKNGKHAGEWTATGKQFAVPYVFKTLFSHEAIRFEDLCETFSVAKGALYLDYNESLPDVSGLEKEREKLIKKDLYSGELDTEIEAGHDLRFVGRVGQFTPVLSGNGGGVLYRVDNGKNYAAAGSTGFRWLESDVVKGTNEDSVDISFYRKLVDDAVDTISQYGDFEWFVSDDPYIPQAKDPQEYRKGAPDEIPFEEEDKWKVFASNPR